jgi:hypothetical protein
MGRFGLQLFLCRSPVDRHHWPNHHLFVVVSGVVDILVILKMLNQMISQGSIELLKLRQLSLSNHRGLISKPDFLELWSSHSMAINLSNLSFISYE